VSRRNVNVSNTQRAPKILELLTSDDMCFNLGPYYELSLQYKLGKTTSVVPINNLRAVDVNDSLFDFTEFCIIIIRHCSFQNHNYSFRHSNI
jgi:hypothetical protein